MGEKRATTVPARSTRNFSKFQVMSLVAPSPGCSVFSHEYSSHAPSPFTSIFENIGKLTLYVDVAKARISASVPGSWDPN
jgi:hypothetical protein